MTKIRAVFCAVCNVDQAFIDDWKKRSRSDRIWFFTVCVCLVLAWAVWIRFFVLLCMEFLGT